MLSLLFASRARLDRDLAVEKTRREILDRENRELRERLRVTEQKLDRLTDASLARAGAIHEPLRDTPRPAASAQAVVTRAFGRHTYASGLPPSASSPADLMPDS